nr:MAG TPA: Protein of unknown function (DUF2500) [Herelleviridae sp.]
MKKSNWIVLGFIILTGLVSGYGYYKKSNNEQEITIHGKVIKKYGEQKSRYKSTKIYTDFIMVIKSEKYGYLDFNVTPSTFAQFGEGSYISFPNQYLRDYDKEVHTSWQIGMGLFLGSGFISLILLICLLVSIDE